jgi:hypothetical protein
VRSPLISICINNNTDYDVAINQNNAKLVQFSLEWMPGTVPRQVPPWVHSRVGWADCADVDDINYKV